MSAEYVDLAGRPLTEQHALLRPPPDAIGPVLNVEASSSRKPLSAVIKELFALTALALVLFALAWKVGATLAEMFAPQVWPGYLPFLLLLLPLYMAYLALFSHTVYVGRRGVARFNRSPLGQMSEELTLFSPCEKVVEYTEIKGSSRTVYTRLLNAAGAIVWWTPSVALGQVVQRAFLASKGSVCAHCGAPRTSAEFCTACGKPLDA